MGTNTGLYAALEERIALCRARFEAGKNDAAVSASMESELDQLEHFRRRLDRGETPAALYGELKQKLAALEEEKDHELEHYTFDWYDDHYYYKVYSGQADACAAMLELIERSGEETAEK